MVDKFIVVEKPTNDSFTVITKPRTQKPHKLSMNHELYDDKTQN